MLKKVAVAATKTALRSHNKQWISGPAPESPSYSVDKNGTQVRKNWKRHAERERKREREGGGGGREREKGRGCVTGWRTEEEENGMEKEKLLYR